MSNGRRSRRSESNLGPSNEAAAFRGIILIVVASVLGILLLWKGIDGPNPETNVAGNDSPATTVVESDQDGTENSDDSENSDGSLVTEDTTTTTTTTLFPPTPVTEVTVLVANGSGIAGGAGQITDVLIAQGYVAKDPANAIPTEYTGIYFRTGMSQEARAVQELLAPGFADILLQMPDGGLEVPDGTVERVEESDIVVILGSDGVILSE
tara:strand:- start:1084 stop:1713 length:630 start_codon:yes stop_codon:yes gene_type:complete